MYVLLFKCETWPLTMTKGVRLIGGRVLNGIFAHAKNEQEAGYIP